jgi:hypothetical protein
MDSNSINNSLNYIFYELDKISTVSIFWFLLNSILVITKNDGEHELISKLHQE